MCPTADSEEISQGTSHSSNTNSASSDALTSPEPAKPHTRELTLNMLFKEMIFCVALALTTYGALHNSPTKVSKHPQAVRFFGRGSPVTDWYRGQLGNALAAINRADVSFVMYYAPWDAECQYVRGEFEKAAMVLGDRVHFSAINCWNPGSECRLQHNKIPSWPIIMAYTVTSRGVLYKGPRDAPSMITFLELIMKPVRRVSNTEDLVNLLSICDAVAVGYTPLLESSHSYNIWYNVALKVRELDTLGEMCFASVTSEELAVDLGVDNVPTARLMLWNDTKEFPYEYDAWNESTLVTWLLDNFSQPVARIIPMWKKAFSFERFVDGNPILMLFTPLNPMYEQIPNYALLREVAMEYYNCKDNESSQWITELLKLQQVQRFLYQKSDVRKFCQEYKIKKPPKPQRMYKKEVISQYNKYPWHNTTQKNQKSSLFNFVLKRGLAISKYIESSDGDSGLLSALGLLEECSTNVFPAEKSFYENEQCQTMEDNLQMERDFLYEHLGTSMLPSEEDHLSSENLVQENIHHYCKLMKFAYELGPPVLPAPESSMNITHIHGLSCAKNYSLYMIAVDSVRNYHFAESLGIDIKNKKDMTAVVILDSKHESQYVLSEEYSAKSVRDFIYNFTHKRLKRSLRSNVADAANTHFFGSDGAVVQGDVGGSAVNVTDLSTRTFRRVVATPGKVSLVAMCAGACGAMTTRALVSAARLLAECNVPVHVARLDALRHDLPWHYTPETYPTVMVLPPNRNRESESLVPPQGQRVTAGALVALALRALGTPHHMRVRLALCQRAKATEKKTCLRDVKEHIATVIGRNLKYWRRASTHKLRSAISERLQKLHQVSFELSLLHVADLYDDGSQKRDSLLNTFTSLAKTWDIDASLLKKSTAVNKTKKS